MTWENLTADADALRRSLGYDQWDVLGHSFGGQVALEYALRYPDRVSRLLLFDTCADSHWYTQSAPAILRKRGYSASAAAAAQRFFTGNVPPNEMGRTVLRFLRAYFYHLGLRDLPEAIVSALRLKMRPEAQVFAFGTLLKGWSVMDDLCHIDIPTLVLAGRFDFLFPPEHHAILADRLQHAHLEIIERAGHNAHAERADEVIDIVRRFMATHSSRAANRWPVLSG
jgi:proline iminopeptidase